MGLRSAVTSSLSPNRDGSCTIYFEPDMEVSGALTRLGIRLTRKDMKDLKRIVDDYFAQVEGSKDGRN